MLEGRHRMTETEWFEREMPFTSRLYKKKVRILSMIALIVSSFMLLPVSAIKPFNEQNPEQYLEAQIYLPIVGNSNSLSGNGAIYYVSPSGDDNKSGQSELNAWATFVRAWKDMTPGDTLILMDGVYNQSLYPSINGQEGSLVTIKAQHDGQAIIDGQGVRDPIVLEVNRHYFIIEGIVAMNGKTLVNPDTGRTPGSGVVITIKSDHNILRRISAYNANTDDNSFVILITGDHNLLEDCVTAGTGRKMIMVFGHASNNIIRRCFTQWTQWDGRSFCQISYPYGANIELYDSNNNTVENSIAYAYAPAYMFGVKQQNKPPASASNNKFLGNMAVFAGRYPDGSLMFDPWPTSRPPVNSPPCDPDTNNLTEKLSPGIRVGFWIAGAGILESNLWQDNFAYGNAAVGLTNTVWGPFNDNRLVRFTMVDNGFDNPDHWSTGVKDIDIRKDELEMFSSVEDSYIGAIYDGTTGQITSLNGGGAQITHRYNDGILTDQYLWPWPMEERIKSEFQEIFSNPFSVTCEIGQLINLHTNYPITNINVDDYCLE